MKDGRTERTKDGGKKGKNKGRRKGDTHTIHLAPCTKIFIMVSYQCLAQN